MFYLINSIPVWIRIFVLIVCEILLIYEYAKGKFNNNKTGKSFMMFLIVFVPIFIGIMLIKRFKESGLISGSYLDATMGICIATFVIGFWVVVLTNIIKGNVPNLQKRMIIGSFIGFLLAAICIAVITILEKI